MAPVLDIGAAIPTIASSGSAKRFIFVNESWRHGAVE